MPKLHEEATMEGEICNTLQTKGWLYDYGADVDYDRQRALYPPDLIAWVRQTQPEVWQTLAKRHVGQRPVMTSASSGPNT